MKLLVANSLWLDDTLKLKTPYQRTMAQKFRATIEQTDFDGDPLGSAGKVNRWASQKTRGKISNVLAPDPSIRAVLANAIYFKGNWSEQFDAKRTRPATFFAAGGTRVKANMMHQSKSFAYAETPELQAIKLPYQGDELEMTLLLPSKNSSLSALEKNFSPSWLRSLAFRRQPVNTSIPKFKLEAKYKLKQPLTRMGMGRAFSNGANFARMSPESLKIDKVNHDTYVEVDEKGTEAAAVTTVTMVRTTSVARRPVAFRADRPFLFTITHRPSRTQLFLGRITNPNA